MGRGSDYSGKYHHFMLFDDENFQLVGNFILKVSFDATPPNCLLNEIKSKGFEVEINDTKEWEIQSEDDGPKFKALREFLEEFDCVRDVEHPEQFREFDEVVFEYFKQDIATNFNTYEFKYKYKANQSYTFASTETFEIGMDFSGGLPCLFVEAKTYDNGDEVEHYRIDGAVKKGFNRLIRDYPNLFSFPTSAWTSERLTEYNRTDP